MRFASLFVSTCSTALVLSLFACGSDDGPALDEATAKGGGSGGASGAGGSSNQGGAAGAKPEPPVNLACPKDAASPNNTQGEALTITVDEDKPGLTVCVGAPDWFRLELPLGSEMQVDACTEKGGGKVSFEFFREEFQVSSEYHGGGSFSSGTSCEGTSLFAAPGVYFFKVSTEAEQATYELRVFLRTAMPQPCKKDAECFTDSLVCTDGGCNCKADAYEPNDTAAQAKPLPLETKNAIVGCFDEDWFTVPGTAGKDLSLKLSTPSLLGYYFNLEIYAADDPTAPLGFYPMTTADDPYVFTPPKTGDYLLRVRNSGNFVRSYGLEVK